MILQALTKLYEDLYAQDRVPRYGWGNVKIGYVLSINESGELENVIPMTTETDNKKKPLLNYREFSLPMAVKRASGVLANFMCDNSSYFLGVDQKGKPKRSIECFEASKELHKRLLSGLESKTAKAILEFFDTWEPEKASEHPALAEHLNEVLSGANLIFRVSGEFAHNDSEIAAAWDRYFTTGEGETTQCLISGKDVVPEAIHPSIKGVKGAQSSGASIVSFNAPAFCSYGKEQNYNAPVGKYATFAYTTALNYLLADNENKHYIGDTAVVCWADGAEPQYDVFANYAFFGEEPPQQITTDQLRATLKNLANGLNCEELNLDLSRRFYILGLAPNAARLSVSFFYSGTFGELMKNVAQHHERLEIIGRRFDIMPLWAMLKETVNQNSKDKTPSPTMTKSVARAVFTGISYPAALLQATMLRIRAERDITAEKAAIIKAYYLKNGSEGCPKEVLTVSLNENSTNIPYTLGRLFAVYEAVQEAANPGINATIKDKYFNSAAATPAMVFPVLDNLAAKHLRKLDTGKKIYFDKQIAALKMLMSETNPTRLTLPEQGSFYIGYYHQKEARFTKKEDK